MNKQEMKLIHFRSKPFDKNFAVHSVDQQKPYFKPNGFWVSDEDDYGWKAWCESEGYRVKCLVVAYAVLIDYTKILCIRSVDELDEFSKQYAFDRMFVDWISVAKRYSGILITPYLWDRRFDVASAWYYSWDCASGCIWDKSAILGMERIPIG